MTSTEHSPRTGSTAVPAPLRDRLRQHAWPFLLLWIASIALVGAAIATNREISPIDEAAHLDYILRIPEEYPAAGEPMLQETLEIWACHGTQLDFELPPCGSATYDHEDFLFEGYGLAGIHPPVYYVVTDILGNSLRAATGLGTLDAYRLAGAVWLGLALTSTYMAAVSLGARRSTALGFGLMVLSLAHVVTFAAALAPDIATWAVGGFVFLASIRHRGRWRDTAVLLVLGVLLGLTNQTGMLAVGATMIFLVAKAPLGKTGGWWRDWVAALGLGLVFVVTSVGWTVLDSALAVLPPEQIPQNQAFSAPINDFPWDGVLLQITALFPPLAGSGVGAFLDSQIQRSLSTLVIGALMFGLVAGTMQGRRDPRTTALALGTLTLALLGGPLLSATTWASTGQFFNIAQRYGFTLVPGFLAVTAVVLTNPAVRRAAPVIGSFLVLLALSQASWFGIARA